MEKNKKIYHTTYNKEESGMAIMEMSVLFNSIPDNHLIISDIDIDIRTSVFIKEKLSVIAEAESFDVLKDKIKEHSFNINDYKIIFFKHQYQDIDYQKRLEYGREIANLIEGSFSLYDPEIIFGITEYQGTWYFGIYEKNNKDWRKHFDKPASFSNSLPVRIARTVVNIAGENNKELKIVDPCCGAGTVLLEAYDLGYSIEGFDINFKNLRNCRENLKHYKYDIKCLHSDIKDLDDYYDVAIVDLPYDLYAKISYEEQIDIIRNAYRIADKLVLITNMDNRKELEETGYVHIEECQVIKQSFKRYIFIAYKQI